MRNIQKIAEHLTYVLIGAAVYLAFTGKADKAVAMMLTAVLVSHVEQYFALRKLRRDLGLDG